jgi:hypothetical protein
VGDDVDALLEGQWPPASREDCGKGEHQWHILAGDPKHSAYCVYCGKKKRRGKRKKKAA